MNEIPRLHPVAPSRWTAPASGPPQPVQPTETLQIGQTIVESVHRHRAAPLTRPPTEVTVRIPASMVGGVGGYVVGLVSEQACTLPPVRDAEVVPQGESALLKVALDVQIEPDARLLLLPGSRGGACGAFVPTMLAVAHPEPTPPPPRPDLTAVLPLNPEALAPPEEVLAALRSSRQVLVVCHTPPDGDTAGSGLGMRRLLESLGKKADLFLDGPLPGWMREQAAPGEFRSWDEVREANYDTVVVVDVAQAHRIGRAREILERVPTAVVLDHHGEVPTSASLGRRGPTVSWVEPTDAAAVLVASVAEKLEPPAWVGIAEPLVTGILTDTQLFARPVRPETGPILKHLVESRGSGDLESACRRVEPQVAEETRGLLMEPVRFKGALLEPQAEPLRQAALAQHDAYHEEMHAGLALLVVPRETEGLATAAGQLSDPRLNRADLQDVFYARLDALALEKPVAVMLWEQSDCVHVSIRSQEPEKAIELARRLGGGGKPGLAAAQPRRPLSEVLSEVRGWGV